MSAPACWRPVSEAVEDGSLVELLAGSRVAYGHYPLFGAHFLHEGKWYRYEPPTEIVVPIIGWRPWVPD